MLGACRAASVVENVVVAPGAPGVVLPEYLAEEELVRLNLVVGRDTPELLLDEWGMRCTLTFRGARVECGIPWTAVLAGVLRPPVRKRPKFGVIDGGKKD